MKKMVVNSHTTRSDFWKELFPVPLTEMLKVAQDNAARHRDRGGFEMDGLLAFLCCLYGGCQFAVGTDVWATQRKGMMPPPPTSEIFKVLTSLNVGSGTYQKVLWMRGPATHGGKCGGSSGGTMRIVRGQSVLVGW